MPKKRTAVIVGCGAIAGKHVVALQQNFERCSLVGAVDSDIQRAEKLAASWSQWSGEKCLAFDDSIAAAAKVNPDIALIATPSWLHAEQAQWWMNQGAHIVLEKPVALSTADLDALTQAQARTGRTVSVCYITKFSPASKLLHQAVESGRFGRMLHASLSLKWNRNDEYYAAAPWRGTWRQDGGVLMNQATHGIDLLLWLIGDEVESILGTVRRYQRPIEAEDFGAGIIQFRNGACATVDATVNTFGGSVGASLAFMGQTGSVILGGNAFERIDHWSLDSDPAMTQADTVAVAAVNQSTKPAEPGHAAHLREFLDALDNNASPPVALTVAARSVEVVLGIYRSAQEGALVNLPSDFSTSDMVGYFE